MPVKNFLFLFLLTLITLPVLAQQPDQSTYSNDKNSAKKQRINQMMKMEEEGDLIFNHYGVFGVKLATNGYGLFYERGKFLTTKKTRTLTFELNEVKDPKDHKEPVSTDGYTYNYVSVGRLNNMYEFKASYGQQFLLGGKGNKNGVAVTYLYSAGLSLAMLKQYVLDIQVTAQNPNVYRSTYPTIFDSAYVVYDTQGLGGGWNQLTFVPGLNAKLAMRFDYGRYNQNITAFEAGVTGEYYVKEMPLMAYVPPKHLFFNAYISIMFGKRK
ncbi:MAG TPA: hypothetical protein VK711_06545 [Puia sp.]|nr:hypothetical protein [Puia sp.]